MLTRDQETIIAQCTPQGSGAIALLRLSGVDAVTIAAKISRLNSGKSLESFPTHTIHYGAVVSSAGTIVDKVLFLLMRGPHTFTGQDTVEITSHNNPFIIEQIIACALFAGARLAQHGEFSKRAFLHGKLDLLQAEAINELINASTDMALKQSLAQLEGSFSQWLTTLEERLVQCLALSEASFEFIDEEMEFGAQILERIMQIMKDIAVLKKTFNQQMHIRQGIRIALIGSVNAGKSSLFNALLNKKRAIVTNIPGTTRDVIEAGLYVDGNYWTLVDTAGLRETNDIIEQEGIDRSWQEAHKADIVLLVVDSNRPMTDHEEDFYDELAHKYHHKMICVHNKSDQQELNSWRSAQEFPSVRISAQKGDDSIILQALIGEKIKELFARIGSPFLLNQRQFSLLLTLEQKLEPIIAMLQSSVEYELLSSHLQEALEILTELTGKTISEKAMDAVFREFCVGK